MRIIVTRPEPDATAQSNLLRARGHDTILSPMLRIGLLKPDLEDGPDLASAAASVVTSRNALRSLQRHGIPAVLKSLPMYCVGPGTESAARACGFTHVLDGGGDAKALGKFITKHGNPADGPLIRFSRVSTEASGDPLVERLQHAGFTVQSVPSYRVEAHPEFTEKACDAICDGNADAMLVMSPLTGRSISNAIVAADLTLQSGSLVYICISQAAADALGGISAERTLVADKPNQSGLLSVVDRAVAKLP